MGEAKRRQQLDPNFGKGFRQEESVIAPVDCSFYQEKLREMKPSFHAGMKPDLGLILLAQGLRERELWLGDDAIGAVFPYEDAVEFNVNVAIHLERSGTLQAMATLEFSLSDWERWCDKREGSVRMFCVSLVAEESKREWRGESGNNFVVPLRVKGMKASRREDVPI